jgi:hypothetical protein
MSPVVPDRANVLEISRNNLNHSTVKRTESKINIVMKKKLFVIVLVATLFAGYVNAQPCGQGKRGQAVSPEMRATVHQQILPLITAQRMELEKALNEADKAEIVKLRAELAVLRNERLEKMEAFKSNDKIPSLEQRQEMRALHSDIKNLMDQVALISDKYDATIISLLEEIRPEIEKLRQENCPGTREFQNNCPNNQQMKKQGNRNGNKGKGNQAHRGFHAQRMLTPEGFLLLDPTNPLLMTDEFGMPDQRLEINIFPNPAAQSAQVSIEIDQPSQINIMLLDGNGNELRKIAESAADPGLFSTTIEVSNLKDGLYFIKTEAGGKSSIQRLIVKH